MKFCFTVDWEDWYHGLYMPASQWPALERRIKIGHYRLLEMLLKHNIKATYFLLGVVMEEYPELVKEIKDAGHELACHTYSHPFLTTLTREQFIGEIKKCKQLIQQFQDSYDGFRAPYFSIKKENLWALEVLKQEGFSYDSSIFSGNTFRSGIVGFEKKIHTLPNGLTEFPVSNFSLLNFDIGIGGAYNRILPYFYFKKRLKKIINDRHALFYFHPWELDEKQPYIKGLNSRAVHTHYFNLSKTKNKLEKLFNDFEFHPMKEVIASALATQNYNAAISA